MTSIGPSTSSAAYQLPLAYNQMSPNEQGVAIRACILKFLDEVARAPFSEIKTAIGATHDPTVRRHLQYLASTQQVYVDLIGRDPIYCRNGKLAHASLQANVKVGRSKEYVIRTYNDFTTGRTLTLTEYAVSALGETKATSGLRIDLADLDTLLAELTRIRDKIRDDPEVLKDARMVR